MGSQIKYIVILFIIIAIGAGFYFYQADQQKKELVAHNKLQLQRVMKTAKKSSSAGLLMMAAAINKFYKVKGHYPKALLNLYPDFIAERTFITQLPWKYYPEKKNFVLQKSLGDGHPIASMGPDLKLKTSSGTSTGTMIASVKNSKSSQAKSKGKADTETSQTPKLSILSFTKVSENTDSGASKALKEAKLSYTIVKSKLEKDEKFLLSLDDDGFYIWKSKDGFIGFSNIQYPTDKKLAVYLEQSWIEYAEK